MMVGLAIVLYLIRMLTIGIATGIMFVKYNLFPHMRKWQIAIIGVCVSPMIAGMINYLLGLVFIGWPSFFFYVAPLFLAIIWIMQGENRVLLQSMSRDGWATLRSKSSSLGKWGIVDLVVAMGVVGILASAYYGLVPGIRKFFVSHVLFKYAIAVILIAGAFFAGRYYDRLKANRMHLLRHFFFIAFFAVAGSALLAGFLYRSYPMVGSDQSHYELNSRYFLEDKNSRGIDNYTDKRYGSSHRDDHGPLWITALADPRIVADMVGVDDTLQVSNFNLFWTYLCFNAMLMITAFLIVGSGRAGVIALLLFDLYIYEKNFLLLGSRDAFRFIGVLLLFLYAGKMFPLMVQGKASWKHYGFMALCCWLSIEGHEGNVYLMLGMFWMMIPAMFACGASSRTVILCGLSALFGTLVGIAKTINIYLETGKIATSGLISFYGTPVVEQVRQLNATRGAWEKIWVSYSPLVLSMIGLGIAGMIVMLIVAQKKKCRELFVWGLLMLGLLMPLTGAMDWIGYECSRWFLEQLRYRMYFLMIFAISGSWLLVYAWRGKVVKVICAALSVIVVFCWGDVEHDKYQEFSYRHVASCRRLVKQYKSIADKVEEMLSDGKAFCQRQPLLYYLHGTPKLLSHPYTELLIQAKTYAEIKNAINDLQVGAIVLPDGGAEYYDYSLLPFWDYINDEFICLSSGDFGKYVIFINPAFMK